MRHGYPELGDRLPNPRGNRSVNPGLPVTYLSLGVFLPFLSVPGHCCMFVLPLDLLVHGREWLERSHSDRSL